MRPMRWQRVPGRNQYCQRVPTGLLGAAASRAAAKVARRTTSGEGERSLQRMRCDRLPQSVHIRSATFPLSRCVACDRHLPTGDAGRKANFPLSTPECVVLIRARVCALCLDNPVAATQIGVRRMALAIFTHLSEWYLARLARSTRGAFAASGIAHGAGCARSRSRPGISGSLPQRAA
jgi:hypothetical protein